MATLTGNIKGPKGDPGAPAGPQGPAGANSVLSTFAATIGDGMESTFTVTHSLGLDVLVECVNLETGQTCWPVVRRTSPTTVYLDFGDTTPEPQSRRVLMTKVG